MPLLLRAQPAVPLLQCARTRPLLSLPVPAHLLLGGLTACSHSQGPLPLFNTPPLPHFAPPPHHSCRCKCTYHLPCAINTPNVFLDVDAFELWCPVHADQDEDDSGDYGSVHTSGRGRGRALGETVAAGRVV